MTHSLESLLSANPNPFAEAMALGVIRTIGTWLRRAVADGTDIEARSQMLMASHLAGVGQASGTGVGLVHALGHSIGTRGAVAHGTALAAVLPEVLRFYLGTAIASSRWSGSRSASRRAPSRTRPPRPSRSGRSTSCSATSTSAPACGGLGLADDAAIDRLVTDTLDDAAIRNSPRLPTAVEARAILVSVAG